MKKFMCIAIIICILPVCSFAVDLTEFNTNAMVCGEEAIDESTAVITDTITTYTAGNCKFGFKEENNEISRIIIQGNGISFLAYAMAAIMVFDDSPDSFVENSGKLFTAFLLLRSSDEQYNRISTGQLILLKHIDDEYFFTIG